MRHLTESLLHYSVKREQVNGHSNTYTVLWNLIAAVVCFIAKEKYQRIGVLIRNYKMQLVPASQILLGSKYTTQNSVFCRSDCAVTRHAAPLSHTAEMCSWKPCP